MDKVLGIFVTSDKHLDKVIRIFSAANKKGIRTILFFSHSGALLTQSPLFAQLKGARISVCRVGFESHGLKPPMPGMVPVEFATQAMHAELIDSCDRYLVF